MRSERRTVCCSHCGTEFTARVVLRVDQSLPADRRVSLTDGSLFSFRCPNCGKDSYYNHYLLWVDEARSVALCNVTCEEEKAAVDEAVSALNSFGKASAIRRRFVTSPSHLCEKYQIFSAGLDDRVVEIVKLFLTEQVRAAHPQKTITDVLFFPGEEEYGLLFLCPDGNLTVPLTKTQLVQAAAGFVFSDPEPERVDAAWALSFLTGGKPC